MIEINDNLEARFTLAARFCNYLEKGIIGEKLLSLRREQSKSCVLVIDLNNWIASLLTIITDGKTLNLQI